MNKKRQKEAFRYGGKSKIDKNRLSATGKNQKSAKIDFPPRGKIKKRRKSAFRRGGKSKIGKNGFPNIGKTRNQRKSTFPTLGKQKIGEKRLSQYWEE